MLAGQSGSCNNCTRERHMFSMQQAVPTIESKRAGRCRTMRHSLALQATDKILCAFELLLQVSNRIIHSLQIILPLAVRGLIEGQM